MISDALADRLADFFDYFDLLARDTPIIEAARRALAWFDGDETSEERAA